MKGSGNCFLYSLGSIVTQAVQKTATVATATAVTTAAVSVLPVKNWIGFTLNKLLHYYYIYILNFLKVNSDIPKRVANTSAKVLRSPKIL